MLLLRCLVVLLGGRLLIIEAGLEGADAGNEGVHLLHHLLALLGGCIQRRLHLLLFCLCCCHGCILCCAIGTLLCDAIVYAIY